MSGRALRRRRMYARGYGYGQRNVSWSALPCCNREFNLGWGAGQAWLMKQFS